MPLRTLANPSVFLAVSARLLPWLALLTVGLFAWGLWGVAIAPDDYQQGATAKIMDVHVPAAWLGMMGWVSMSAAALGTLVWRHPLADVAIRATAPIGAAFTALCLVTGSLWGQPMWGTWWVWDARLTSVLVLFLMYLGVLALWQAIDEPGRAAKACAVLVLVGAVNIPIIKYSVEWWNTLHQGESVFRMDGPTIAWPMLWPLFVMAAAFTALFAALMLAAMRNEVLRRRIRTMRLVAAADAPASFAALSPAEA